MHILDQHKQYKNTVEYNISVVKYHAQNIQMHKRTHRHVPAHMLALEDYMC